MRNFLYWFAIAVLAALVAGFVQLGVEHSLFQSEEKLIPEEEPAGEFRLSKEYSPSMKTKEEIIDNKSPTDSESIREFLPLALHINSSMARNSALGNLVDSALKIPDLPLAVEITRSINSSTYRNAVYVRIIDKAISREEFKTAESAAREINSSMARNSQIRKILRASTNRLRK